MSNMRIPSSALPIDYFSPWVIVTALFLSKLFVAQTNFPFTPHTRGLLAPRRKARQVQKGKMDDLTTHLLHFFPTFAALASLRDIFRVRLRIRRCSMSLVHGLRLGS